MDDAPAIGLCGSGLLDLVAVLLELNIIDESGRLTCGERYTLPGTDVFLTQKDIREVQLAKAAIRAGIELLCSHLGVRTRDIQQVLLAGAFGNYLAPVSACRIGMSPVSDTHLKLIMAIVLIIKNRPPRASCKTFLSRIASRKLIFGAPEPVFPMGGATSSVMKMTQTLSLIHISATLDSQLIGALELS